jgi:hypothetical protein
LDPLHSYLNPVVTVDSAGLRPTLLQKISGVFGLGEFLREMPTRLVPENAGSRSGKWKGLERLKPLILVTKDIIHD